MVISMACMRLDIVDVVGLFIIFIFNSKNASFINREGDLRFLQRTNGLGVVHRGSGWCGNKSIGQILDLAIMNFFSLEMPLG